MSFVPGTLIEIPSINMNKAPSVKYVARDVFDKTIDFVKRVGTIIVFCSI